MDIEEILEAVCNEEDARALYLCPKGPDEHDWYGIVTAAIPGTKGEQNSFWLRLAYPFAGKVFCAQCCAIAPWRQDCRNLGQMTLTGVAHVIRVHVLERVKHGRA